MQTFLPYKDFEMSARALDYRRLGKQRLEAWQLLETLCGTPSRWENHPACKMWRGHLHQLCVYGMVICDEWKQRGYKDTMAERFEGIYRHICRTTTLGRVDPPWLGDERLHLSHRANLVRKDPYFYIPKFGKLESIPYWWPV